MCSSQPAIAIKFVVIEAILADQFGIFRAAAAHAVTHVEDDQAIAPVSQISQAIFYLQVVQITSAGHRSHFCVQGDDGRILGLPACNFFGMFGVLKINDAQRAGGVVSQIYVVPVDVRAVHAAADGGRVFGENFQMGSVGGVKENNSILAVGRAFASEDSDAFVGRGADVIDQARIYFEGVEELGICGIGNVVDKKLVGNCRKVGVMTDDPFLRHLQVGHGNSRDDLEIALHV